MELERPSTGPAVWARAVLGIALLAALLPARAGAHDAAHDARGHRESYSAGEPGDPAKSTRSIEVVMTEMAFEPELIEVKRGEQVRFVIRNAGKEDHEFMLATLKENLKHAELMKKHPHMEHADPNGVRLAPNQSAEIVWKFTKAGTFDYSCLIEDHRDLGMSGKVVVK